VRRLETNPLRILDSKNPNMQALIERAPQMRDYLDQASSDHFAELLEILDYVGQPYVVNPRLVRGLDYYNLTVFEWITDALGSQGAVCAGGRYDGLVEKLGGRSTPAIGWAMGVERLVGLYEACGGDTGESAPDVYVVAVGDAAIAAGMAAAENLRDAMPALKVELNLGGGNFKAQLKRADKSGAAYAVIIGEDEMLRKEAGLKPLRTAEDQTSVALDELARTLAERLKR